MCHFYTVNTQVVNYVEIVPTFNLHFIFLLWYSFVFDVHFTNFIWCVEGRSVAGHTQIRAPKKPCPCVFGSAFLHSHLIKSPAAVWKVRQTLSKASKYPNAKHLAEPYVLVFFAHTEMHAKLHPVEFSSFDAFLQVLLCLQSCIPNKRYQKTRKQLWGFESMTVRDVQALRFFNQDTNWSSQN